MNHRQLVLLTSSWSKAYHWSFDTNLLVKKDRCDQYGNRIILSDLEKQRVYYFCNNCRKKTPILEGSILSGRKLSLLSFIDFEYFFFNVSLNGAEMMKESNLGSNSTVVEWRKIFRNICLETYILNAKKIGGPGTTVEIDETLTFKRKYNRGRFKEEIWLVGGICRETKDVFITRVYDRTAKTMKQVISMWVAEGTTRINTDFWRAYNSAVSVIPSAEHCRVNHSERFVSDDGSHTQNIECFWGVLKGWMRKNGYNKGRHDYIVEYMGEYLYKRRFGYCPMLFHKHINNYINNFSNYS